MITGRVGKNVGSVGIAPSPGTLGQATGLGYGGNGGFGGHVTGGEGTTLRATKFGLRLPSSSSSTWLTLVLLLRGLLSLLTTEVMQPFRSTVATLTTPLP